MKKQLFLTLIPGLYAGTIQADIEQAEQAIRRNNAAEALLFLQDATPGSDYHFWKGHALLKLNRFEEAAAEFSAIEKNHPKSAHAATALIYCARRCADGANMLTELTTDSHAAVAQQASLALAELLILQNRPVELQQLKERLGSTPETHAAILLLEAEQLRRRGQSDAAMSKCREVEKHGNVRQREYSRLIIAEIYYDLEKMSHADTGKGEETLLKFISAEPNSSLLEEAFRRLDQHGAFTGSKYAIRSLEEWSRDTAHLSRSLLATAIIQREALFLHGNVETAELSVNRATGINTEYAPITVQMNNRQAAHLIGHGNAQAAAEYLNRIPDDKKNAYTHFYRAQTKPEASDEALALYLQSAAGAPDELLPIALANALYCAHNLNREDVTKQILSGAYPEEVRRSIKLTYAGLNLRKAPTEARAALNDVMAANPTYEEKVEAALRLSQLDIDEQNGSAALSRLEKFTNSERTLWQNEQVMRYYGLYLHALEAEQEAGRATDAHKDFLTKALQDTKREDVAIAITFKLAQIYSEANNHIEALHLLEKFAQATTDRNLRARALLLAGRESTQCLTFPSVTKGAALFEAAAKIDSPYRFRSAILNTAVLFRINHVEEAQKRLSRVIREIEQQRAKTPGSTYLAEEYAFALTVQADIEAMAGTEEALLNAIKTNERIFAIAGLTQEWHNRGYLQQAIFCTRTGRHERALLHYNNIINSLPSGNKPVTPDNAYILSLSGTGAIACLLKMKKWEEAANMADRISEHPISAQYPANTAHFSEWAKLIRKTNYLPMKASH